MNFLLLSLSLQAAVDWNYEGKTEAHASQKGLLQYMPIGDCHIHDVYKTSRGLTKE